MTRSRVEKPFLAWDGEGFTTRAPRGDLLPTDYRRAVREETARQVAAGDWTADVFWGALDAVGGRIVPGTIADRGRVRSRGEFVDVPRHLVRRATIVTDGNLDEIAQHVCDAGMNVTGSEVLDWFRAHPRRPSRSLARESAIALLADRVYDPGEHRYYLLANSNGDLLEDADAGLGTRAIFDYLLRAPDALHVVYGASYDMNKWLRDLTRAQVERVYVGGVAPVHITLDGRTYALGWRQRRSLFLARFAHGPRYEERGGRRCPRYDAKVTIWDVLGFFQAPFTDALRTYFPDGIADLETIVAMKAERATFAPEARDRIRSYCLRECELLRDLMTRLREAMHTAKIVPVRWDGAGACAAALLKREEVKGYLEPPPVELDRATRCAYFGGRIEMPMLGACDTIAAHDIASAYPWAATALPSLLSPWRAVGAAALDATFGMVELQWNLADAPWYPLPYRTPSGSILFPASGRGWYHVDEARAAIAFAREVGGSMDVLDGWALDDNGERPFAFLHDLFATRDAWRASKLATTVGAEKVLKLAMNSCYGKLAQQLGGDRDRLPPYFSLLWAGAITAATRARLVEAALPARDRVLAFATDGIFTDGPLEALPDYGKALGRWEASAPVPGVFVQAGVYWQRPAPALPWKAKFRGFDRTGMETPDHVLAAWRAKKREVYVPCTRFVTAGSALASADLWPAWGTWRTIARRLDLSGASAKRTPIGPRARPDRGLVALRPAHNLHYDLEGATSAPFALAWESALDAPIVDGVPDRLVEDEAHDSTL